MVQMGKILPTIICTSNSYMDRSTEPHTFTILEAESEYMGGKLSSSVNLNIDVMEEDNDSYG